MKHTQGPWSYAPTGEVMQGYSQPYGVGQYGKLNLIAGCFGDVQGGEEVALANAKLIAAAPDMLDALKTAYNYLSQCCLEDKAYWEEVEIAINKATKY